YYPYQKEWGDSMGLDFDQELEDRLVRYARMDTTSEESSPTTPSTQRQAYLSNLLVDELKDIGASDVTLTDYGVVLATIPSTVKDDVPTIAFLAHVDTTEAYNGAGVVPVVHRSYDGGEITFPENDALVLSPEEFPYLASKQGDDIITAS